MKVHLYRLDNHAVTTLNTCFEVIVFQSDALSVTFAVSASEKLVLVLVGLVNSYSKKSVLAHLCFAKIKNNVLDSLIKKNELQPIKTDLQKSFWISEKKFRKIPDF